MPQSQPQPVESDPWHLTSEQRHAMTREQCAAWDKMASSYRTEQAKRVSAAASPEVAQALGMAYTGPDTPDKGQRDGHCNRSRCQAPLQGRRQFVMDGDYTGGPPRFYCAACADAFNKHDRQMRQPLRCREVL